MELTKYKLGELIELCEARNDNLKYGIDDVKTAGCTINISDMIKAAVKACK